MRPILLATALLVPLPGPAGQPQPCASTLAELRLLAGPAFPARWNETSMADGKPLVVSISDRDGALFLEFTKTGEGLWARSAGLVCRHGDSLEARFGPGQIRVGPAAHWVLRLALERGGKFTLTRLDPRQLRIATGGWSGLFAPGND